MEPKLALVSRICIVNKFDCRPVLLRGVVWRRAIVALSIRVWPSPSNEAGWIELRPTIGRHPDWWSSLTDFLFFGLLTNPRGIQPRSLSSHGRYPYDGRTQDEQNRNKH